MGPVGEVMELVKASEIKRPLRKINLQGHVRKRPFYLLASLLKFSSQDVLIILKRTKKMQAVC